MSIDVRQAHGAKVRRTLIYRRARACPSPTSVSPKASRPGGLSYCHTPLLSVGQDRQILTRSRSGDRELQGPVSRRRGDCGRQAPALRGRSISLANVGRGPVPRQRRYHRKRIETGRALLPPCPAPLCRSRSPDLDPFAIRRSRTTGAAMHRPTL